MLFMLYCALLWLGYELFIHNPQSYFTAIWAVIRLPCSEALPCPAVKQPDKKTYDNQSHRSITTLRPKRNGCHFADNIFKCIFLNENVLILFKISLNLFLRIELTISQYWFRLWLGADQATSHYLNQWWLVYWHIHASLSLNEFKIHKMTQTQQSEMPPCAYFTGYTIHIYVTL